MRPLLLPLSILYGAVMRLRNVYYDRGPCAVRRAKVPVISIGNLTVGGTGKTPFVIEVVRRLRAAGHRPAILTRGYAAAAGQAADEVLELTAACPDTPIVVRADRAAGAEIAVTRHGADCLVLDDGFQHRRLGRDLDVVLIDALNPWGAGPTGSGGVLPAGRLREPLAGLRRAQLVLITRTNQADPAAITEIERRIRGASPRVEVLRAEVRAERLVLENDEPRPPAELADWSWMAVCGLGNPGTFYRLLESLAGEPPAAMTFPDHHRYGVRDVEEIARIAGQQGCDLVVTTRKDWVKLAPVWQPAAGPLRLARLELRIDLHDPEQVLAGALQRAVCRSAAPDGGSIP